MPFFTIVIAILVGVWSGANLTLPFIFALAIIGVVIFLYFWFTVGFEELGGILTIIVLIHVGVFIFSMAASYGYYEHGGSIGSLKDVIFRH